MSEHTKGPWHVLDDYGMAPGAYSIGGPCNERSGDCLIIADTTVVNGKANARLIAAAPEMLEELEAALDLLLVLWRERGEPAGILELVINSAEKVVRKAKGES